MTGLGLKLATSSRVAGHIKDDTFAFSANNPRLAPIFFKYFHSSKTPTFFLGISPSTPQ
jgi:hypothetical protein